MSEQVTRTLPAPFIEAAGIALTDKLTHLLGQPIDTAAFAPTVAAQDPLQQQAIQKAERVPEDQRTAEENELLLNEANRITKEIEFLYRDKELEKIDIRNNNNTVNKRFSTYVNRQSR